MARTKAGFIPVKTLDGSPPAMEHWPLVSGTYYEGQVLRLSGTSGSATHNAAAGTSVAGVMACYVSTANSTSGTYPAYISDGNTIFEAKMLASQAPRAKVGDVVDIAVSTGNYRLQNTASTSVVSIVGFHPDESLSAHTGCRYWVKFAKSVWAATKVSSAAP